MSEGKHLGTQYRQHLETLDQHLQEALASAGRQGLALEGVLFHAGRLQTYHGDDRLVPFYACGHFRRWVPLEGPEHAVLARPGQKPLVVRYQPQDFWYDTSPPANAFWQEAVDVAEIAHFSDITKVTGTLDRIAYVGDSKLAAQEAGIPEELVEPDALMAPLDWYRAYKTEYEVSQLRQAAVKAARGHLEAKRLFFEGASEREIHWAYLAAAGHLEFEVPYETIVAFDTKSAILHYQHKRGGEAAPGKVFLLDAGADSAGYAADITRTWALPEVDSVFHALIQGVDALERKLVAMVTAGQPYVEIHRKNHRLTCELLHQTGIFKVGVEEAMDKGLSRPFLPHGVGHQLGLQVHDVGGHQAGPEGGLVPPPEEYPFLRNTRILEPGHVVTIEPGLYFIPMLLEPTRHGDHASCLDWGLVDRLTPCGGIRIEDNIVCTEDKPIDLTRDLIAGP